MAPTPLAVSLKVHDRQLSMESVRSTGSQIEYSSPDQTIIIVDWDDTLCPSSFVKKHGLKLFDPHVPNHFKPVLEKVAKASRAVLEKASELGKVVIVTNAEEGWIDLSCKQWLPSLRQTLDKFTIVSARSTWEPRGISSPAGWKARTFNTMINQFYSRYLHQSWKNVLSIGDSPHEMQALNRVTLGTHDPSFNPTKSWQRQTRKCRWKTVKFMIKPSAEQLVTELEMLAQGLPQMVNHDQELAIEISA